MSELTKRVITSIILLTFFILSLYINFLLSVLIISIFFQLFFEIFYLSKKIIKKKNYLYLFLFICLIYLFLLLLNIWQVLTGDNFDKKIFILMIISICIATDCGGYIFGKFFKGKKLTKISPNKTYSGMIGSYILSYFLVTILFYDYFNVGLIIILIFLVSTISQIGDLFISFIKRKIKVKDTSSILPGHGGLLDRFDGLIFALPFSLILFEII